ncbi:hypothetical protein PHYBLDRAFT_185716 [Phycomyces blakesleeanus NRRL 1555(-)]|uniref:Uncharacterized protein n=1 Tax=Phycomyces blakesleeanus (strain ATCC 8743b / DSM 1359 / FGSC 10004 / NBRC 33097 / NRRL 1555) TaxID=763407 RepID=A0A167PIJ9_PHYB8|nr:hypothetical protein PHYBLDRAFT_185716 [Phycomyces blakesleeanus NRRL 1555(-)]OAD78007.1 hypothetical protein PHYBLDRAFT_185716 [Phycomyces blakesleeanus NRRL 1555(-)]|eukprot:XP_018296047.1 hypothetical protein PHYBLDRAFT_185716 [Phycomyces blakesleeanus NRRL 1555(-)]
MSSKTSTLTRSLPPKTIKSSERERRQNDELAETKKALQLSEAKNSACNVRLAKWKKIALDAERSSSLKMTDYENKLKKDYEAQLEEIEAQFSARSKEAAETIERLEDTNKKLKKEIALLKMKDNKKILPPTPPASATSAASVAAEPSRVIFRRATVQTDQSLQTVPPPVHVSRAKSNALVFSINDTVRAIEDELRSHRRRPTDETNSKLCDKDETLVPTRSQSPISNTVLPEPINHNHNHNHNNYSSSSSSSSSNSHVPSQRHLRNLGHEAVVPRSNIDLGRNSYSSSNTTNTSVYSTTSTINSTASPPNRSSHGSYASYGANSTNGSTSTRSSVSSASASYSYSRPPRSRTLEHLSRTLPEVFRKRGSQPITSSSLRPTSTTASTPSQSPSTRHSYNNELYTSPGTPQFGHSPSTSSSFSSSYASSETSADFGQQKYHINVHPHCDPRWLYGDTLTDDPVSISPDDNYDYYYKNGYQEENDDDDLKSSQPLSHQLRDSILDTLLSQGNYK